MIEDNTFVSDDNSPQTSTGGCPIRNLAGTPAALNEVCRVFPRTRQAYPAPLTPFKIHPSPNHPSVNDVMCAMTVQLHPQHSYMRTAANEVLDMPLRQDPNSIYLNIACLATCFVPDDDTICLRIQEYNVSYMCRST
jgi:hypothetical protein